MIVPVNSMLKSKKKKARCEIGFTKIHLAISHTPLYRLFGDLALPQDVIAEPTNPYGLGYFNLTKIISSFETDKKSKRINVFYHPFTDVETPNQEKLNEFLPSGDQAAGALLETLSSLESLKSQLPSIVSKVPSFENSNTSWADSFRKGEGPFDTVREPDSANCTVVWELVQVSDQQFDMILKSISMSNKLAEEMGYTWEETLKLIQKYGVPSFFNTSGYFERIQRIYDRLVSILKNTDGTFTEKARVETNLLQKNFSEKRCQLSCLWKIFTFNDQVFYTYSLTFTPTNKGPLALSNNIDTRIPLEYSMKTGKFKNDSIVLDEEPAKMVKIA